jgi:replicative DNA helicase
LRGMAEIVIAKHRNGAVGEVLLRFKGEFTRFSNPEDDMVIPMPGEPAGAMLGSKMNTGNAGSVPPPAPDFAPQTANPFGAPGDGPLPF